jgi:glycosyltransferase involved in cell wall biosynthesis
MEAILNQTYADFDFVILDNGSSAETRELIGQFKDSRIKYHFAEKNSRTFMNSSFNYTNRNYLLITHDDDIMKPRFLERMLDELERGDYDLMGCAIEEIDSSGKSLNRIRGNKIPGLYELNNKTPLSEYLNHNFIACPTIIFKSSFIRENQIKWDWSAGLAFDANLLVSCLSLGAKVANLGEPLYLYRIHENQDSMMNMVPMHLDLFTHWMRRTDIRFSKDEISSLHNLALSYIKMELSRSKGKYSNLKKSFNYLTVSIRKNTTYISVKYLYMVGCWLIKYKIKSILKLKMPLLIN